MDRILIVEDDKDINQLIQMLLEGEGYEVSTAFSGTEGELRLKIEKIDLLICDLMLPGISGEELIQKVREDNSIPIIALTAKGSLEDKVNVIELGADDYMTKPFEPKELLVRVKAQLRRMGMVSDKTNHSESYIKFRNLELNIEEMTATLEGRSLEFTQREFQILELMMKNPKKVFSKDSLYEMIWEQGYYGEDNTISVHVSNIRKKIEAITKEEYISTVWGIGYRLHL